jgi:hypothetical protein
LSYYDEFDCGEEVKREVRRFYRKVGIILLLGLAVFWFGFGLALALAGAK